MEELYYILGICSLFYLLLRLLSLFLITHNKRIGDSFELILGLSVMLLYVFSLPLSVPIHIIDKRLEKINDEEHSFSISVAQSNARHDERNLLQKEIAQAHDDGYEEGYFAYCDDVSSQREESYDRGYTAGYHRGFLDAKCGFPADPKID